jgi:hypothetical protein
MSLKEARVPLAFPGNRPGQGDRGDPRLGRAAAHSRYHADKGRYPETLESLAADRYLRKVPLDPVTDSAATWIVIAPPGPRKSGVYDVKSGSPPHEQW